MFYYFNNQNRMISLKLNLEEVTREHRSDLFKLDKSFLEDLSRFDHFIVKDNK